MDSRQLRYFVAVYEQRNISHAASHCNVAQSALSHHVGNLEAELNTALFVRKARGMEPTAAGVRLYGHAKAILRAMEHAGQDLRQAPDQISGEIAIGIVYSVIHAIGARLIERVLKDYPKVRLVLVEGLSGAVLSNLLASEVELATIYNPPVDQTTVREPLLEEGVYCVGKTSVIGSTIEPITFEELTRLPMILLGPGGMSRSLIDHPALLSKLEAGAVLRMNSVIGINRALRAGFGCSLVGKIFVREHLQSGELHFRPVVEPEIKRTLYLVRRANDLPTHLNETLRKLIRELIAEEIANGGWDATPLR